MVMVEDTRREAMEEEELKESYWAKLTGQPDQERTQDLNPVEIQNFLMMKILLKQKRVSNPLILRMLSWLKVARFP